MKNPYSYHYIQIDGRDANNYKAPIYTNQFPTISKRKSTSTVDYSLFPCWVKWINSVIDWYERKIKHL